MGKSLPIDSVVEKLDGKLRDVPLGEPSFADKRYISINFDTGNFHQIPSYEEDSTLCFLDGGNMEVVSAPNLMVELTRLYFNKYRGKSRLNPKELPQKIDFYTVCCAVSRKNKIVYETELVPVKDEWTEFLPESSDLTFNSMDRTLMTGLQRASIDVVARSARVFAEWKLAGLLVERELEEGDIIIRDGSLQTFVTNERKYANRTYNAAIENEVIFTGLSKTSTLFTSTGQPLVSAINELSAISPYYSQAWFYNPIVHINQPDHRAEMYAVKLCPRSSYVFRFEILLDQAENMDNEEKTLIISSLAANSHDISFPGYPYGLIDVDRFARVEMVEKEAQELQFMSAASAKGVWPKIQRFVKASDAHVTLNEI
ncbi:MAG: DNA double-strand break repair nuclease NurA [Candidatus Bathyarchaeota archaeon]|nr:DNA double-strand break repair nuclease NurA [Candidatus Bathyarchaeota archaeon]